MIEGPSADELRVWLQNYTVNDKGFVFRFDPYAVGSWAEGSYAAAVPYEKLAPLFNEFGTAFFESLRPGADGIVVEQDEPPAA